MGYNVAIDGPAGAGKSTIAKLVAKEKGYIYVDTGAMYRGLAIHFLNKGIEPGETDKVIEACKDAEVTIAYEDGVQHVYLNGNDISSRLRNEDMTREIAPLKQAEDAVLVDSSHMTIEEVVKAIVDLCK